jgi:hypothetical protein
MSVTLRHPTTGDIKVLPEGWSWSCCIGSLFLGLPLFHRGLRVWGSAMVVFNIVAAIVALIPTERAERLDRGLTLIGIGLAVFFGFQANRMALDRYLDLGWLYAGQEPKRPGFGRL